MRMEIIRQIVIGALLLVVSACSRPRTDGREPIVAAGSSVQLQPPQDPTAVYHQMGLIATGSPLPFVGKIAYFALSSGDSTLMLASVSIPNRALSFVREGDSYR